MLEEELEHELTLEKSTSDIGSEDNMSKRIIAHVKRVGSLFDFGTSAMQEVGKNSKNVKNAHENENIEACRVVIDGKFVQRELM